MSPSVTSTGAAPSDDRGAGDRDSRLRAERENLLRAAWAVMKRSGYANASITEILNEAEISTRAFYRHFASKDDLLLTMFRENAERTAMRLVERVLAAGSPREQLDVWIDAILDMGYDPGVSRTARLFVSNSVRAVFADAGQGAISRLHAPLRDVLVAGRASGVFPDADPEQDAETIHVVTWRLFEDAVFDRAVYTRDEARAHVLRFALPALGAVPG